MKSLELKEVMIYKDEERTKIFDTNGMVLFDCKHDKEPIQWISVEDRVPEHWMGVTTVDEDGDIEQLHYNTVNKSWCFFDGENEIETAYEITHWIETKDIPRP